MSRTWRIGISLALSAVFLGLAARGIDWSAAARQLASANHWYFPLMLIVTVWGLYIRAQRWRMLLRPMGSPPLPSLVSATNIGFMANMVLPLRVGEVIRPLFLSRREKTPLGGVLATIVLERVLDLMCVVLMFGVAAWIGISGEVQAWGLWILLLAIVIALGIAVIRFQEARALRLVRFVLRPFPTRLSEGGIHFFEGFVQALEILGSFGDFVRLAAWTVYLWGTITLVFLIGILAFQLDAPLVLGSLVVSAVTAVAVSAPSAPGYIGAFQLGCTVSLGLFGIGKEAAFAYSVVLHLSQFVAVIGAGLYSLAKEGLSLRSLGEASETDAAGS